jgi:hemoglobin
MTGKRITIAFLLACVLAVAGCASTPPRGDALYQELGGRSGIEALVETLLFRVSDDPRIAHHFADVDIIHLNDRLVEFICVQAGGPCAYTGKPMAAAHRHVTIAEADFNALVENLMGAMDARKVPRTTQNHLLRRLAALQREVVRRGPPPPEAPLLPQP